MTATRATVVVLVAIAVAVLVTHRHGPAWGMAAGYASAWVLSRVA